MTIDIIKIFPSIGIARLGNSPPDWPVDRVDKGEFFVGPEFPGEPTPPSGGYKDPKFRVKRQAVRFHLFGYEAGQPSQLVKEITLIDADIKWTVELANTKAAWKKFGGIGKQNLPLRNAEERDRDSLCIIPGRRTLDGPNQKAAFDSGAFRGRPVPLGEIQTDAHGCLLVLGGYGHSEAIDNQGNVTDSPLGSHPGDDFGNNDDWHDDVSDGPVTASVRLKGTNVWIQASPAWVICAPPKFAPLIQHIITLYDTLLQVAVDRLGFVSPAGPPSFTKHIYPLLARAMNVKWVSSRTGQMAPMIQNAMPLPGGDTEQQKAARKLIFSRLRNPSAQHPEDHPTQDMPKIFSDLYPVPVSEALTKTQYHVLQQWRDGNFLNDWSNPQVPESQISPDGLTRAALESCVGGSFFPGIETSFMTRDTYPFIEPFRLDAEQLRPGDLTKQMAVPWQSDFFDCTYEEPYHWWPAQRPDDVFPTEGPQQPWIRDIINSSTDMVHNWHKLGFVVKHGDRFVETERHA
jgi:hypothetical protein